MKPKGIDGIASGFVKKFRIKASLKYIEENSNVLDIGCGFAEIAEFLPEEIKYIGIEKDEYLFNYCKKKYPKKTFLFGSAEEIIKKLDDKFDVILLLSVIEHLNNPFKFILNLKNILKEKGKIIIYTPSKKAKIFLSIGSKIGILSKVAEKEHKSLIDFFKVKEILVQNGYKFVSKKNYLFGLSYIIIFEK